MNNYSNVEIIKFFNKYPKWDNANKNDSKTLSGINFTIENCNKFDFKNNQLVVINNALVVTSVCNVPFMYSEIIKNNSVIVNKNSNMLLILIKCFEHIKYIDSNTKLFNNCAMHNTTREHFTEALTYLCDNTLLEANILNIN